MALGIVLGSLALGMLGYRAFEGLPWIDALLNAAMLLGGMGPVNALQTTAGKLFASFYALYSGVVFLASAGIVFAPLFTAGCTASIWRPWTRSRTRTRARQGQGTDHRRCDLPRLGGGPSLPSVRCPRRHPLSTSVSENPPLDR